MSEIFKRFANEIRSSLENPVTPLSYPAEWLLDVWNGGKTDSGIRVSELTALQVGCVFAAVNIIASAIGALPLHVYAQSLANGRLVKTIDPAHELYDLLTYEPNPEMTPCTFRRTFMCHALLWGNAYAELQHDNGGRICAMWPRNPARTRPVRLLKPMVVEDVPLPIGALCYKVDEPFGGSQIEPAPGEERIEDNMRFVLPKNILHVKGLSLDGRVGQDTVNLARQAIGLALAQEKYAGKFFGNGAVPRGVLYIDGAMNDPELATLKKSWHESYGGENAQRTAVLEPGMEFKPISVDPKSSMLIEGRQFQAVEVAALFGLPIHMLGEGNTRISEKTSEAIGAEFVHFALKPWLVAIQQEFVRKMLPGETLAPGCENLRSHICEFDTRALIYPDAKSRALFYDGGSQWGYLSTNDIREFEGMNPASEKECDKYFIPVQYRAKGDVTPKPVNNAPALSTPPPENKSVRRLDCSDDAAYFESARKQREKDPYFAKTPEAFKKK